MADDDPFLASLADPPRLGPIGVSTHREQTLTLPWFAGMTLAPARKGDILYDVATPNPRRAFGTLGLELRHANGDLIQQVRPTAGHDEHAAYVKTDVDSDHPRRIVVDVSPLLPRHLHPGDYVATVTFSGGAGATRTCASEPLPIRWVAPSRAQQRLRDALEPMRAKRGSWFAAFDPPTAPWVGEETLAPTDPFAWPHLHALATHHPEQFATLPQQTFAGFPAALAPEITLLNIQWLLATRRGEEAVELARSARALYPGIGYALDALRLGN